MKRFYRQVTTAPTEGGFAVLLDGRPLRTPGRRPLTLPTPALAQAVAAEWQAQEARVDPRRMPLTRLATTVVDRMPARRGDALAQLLELGRSDTLCYRVDHPRELARRQQQAWQPWLDWLAAEFGARLVATKGLTLIPQPEHAIARLEAVLRALDSWRLVGVHALAVDLHSLVLALAVERGALTAERAFELAHLEELYEIERWGEVDLQRRRHAELRTALEAAARFLALLPPAEDTPSAGTH